MKVPSHRFSKVLPASSKISIITLVLVFTGSLFMTVGCGSEGIEEEINPQERESLEIPLTVSHALKTEQLEINSDHVLLRDRSYTEDEIEPPEHEPRDSTLVALYKLAKAKRALDATKGLKEEIEKNPENARAYCYLGKVYRLEEDFDKALSAFDRAIELAPHDSFPYCLRAETNFALERYDKAIADCNKTLTLNSTYTNALAIRGESYLFTSRFENAAEDLNKCAELKPDNASLQVDLGDAYLGMESYDRAIQAYGNAVKKDPENGLYYARRARAYILWGKPKEAAEDRRKATEHGYKYDADG
ncbi:tetratricopeptide repeat protein [bacterium]|nr:tetratricopeptide repeat protein [bacterium]